MAALGLPPPFCKKLLRSVLAGHTASHLLAGLPVVSPAGRDDCRRADELQRLFHSLCARSAELCTFPAAGHAIERLPGGVVARTIVAKSPGIRYGQHSCGLCALLRSLVDRRSVVGGANVRRHAR